MEVLSPAGSLEKLKYAINYGADAIYTSGKLFGLRAKASNLTEDELKEAVNFCHSKDKKIYVTLNIFGHNKDIDLLPPFIKFLDKIQVDAVIVSDPGIFSLVREIAPNLPIHISTQANVVSWKGAEFWYKLGAERVILARELSIKEIKEIHKKVPKLQLEIFVHGAMCISYSGRCLLSAFLNNRSANQGLCTQPCRWEYALVEKTRPNEEFDIQEDQYGSYIMNSKDLSLLNRLQEIQEAGVCSIKIEGRMKSLYYVANLSRIYKKGLENINSGKAISEKLLSELDKISHRVYAEGFFDGFDSSNTQNYESSTYIRTHQFIGEIISTNEKSVTINIKAKFSLNDTIEFIFPEIEKDFLWKVDNIQNEFGQMIEFTKPNTIAIVNLPFLIPENGIVRIEKHAE